MIYNCPRCHYQTGRKNDMKKHLNRKNNCKPIYSEISIEKCLENLEKQKEKKKNKCEYCNKEFARKCHLLRHLDICKSKIKAEKVEIEKRENELKLEIEKRENELKLEIEKRENELKFEIEKRKKFKTFSNDCIYILQEREFINKNQNVYKIGRSINFLTRMRKYPKGSMINFTMSVEDSVSKEKEILEKFEKEFIKREDVGNEYFEGDIKDMIKQVLDLV